MRSLTFILVAALSACGSPEPDGNGVTANAEGVAAVPASSGADGAGLAAFRAEWLESCIGGARDAAPPGTPVDRHCACAIDRVMADRTLADLEADQESGAYGSRFQSEMRACIAEIPR